MRFLHQMLTYGMHAAIGVYSNLDCIQVSDISWANSIPNLWLDPQQYFSLTCP